MNRSKWATVLAVVVVLAATAAAYPAGRVKPKRHSPKAAASRRDPLGVKDTRSFFQWYDGMNNNQPEKSEFETEAAYRKRLPAFDTSKILYFRVQKPAYDYDIAKRTLTFTPPEMVAPLRDPCPDGTHAVGLPMYRWQLLSTESYRDWVGENGFGATVQAYTHHIDTYCLDLHGVLSAMALALEPDAARRLSSAAELVLSVRLSGYDHSRMELADYREATFDFPDSLSSSRFVIEGTLVEVILRDKHTLGILKRWKPVKKPPVKEPVEHETVIPGPALTPAEVPVPYVPSDKPPVETVVSGLDFTTTTVPVPRQPGR
jgi:hypothetical protein